MVGKKKKKKKSHRNKDANARLPTMQEARVCVCVYTQCALQLSTAKQFAQQSINRNAEGLAASNRWQMFGVINEIFQLKPLQRLKPKCFHVCHIQYVKGKKKASMKNNLPLVLWFCGHKMLWFYDFNYPWSRWTCGIHTVITTSKWEDAEMLCECVRHSQSGWEKKKLRPLTFTTSPQQL